MEDRIKSALEIAMEKAAKLGKLTPEEASEQKWVPEGERVAALYLRGEGDLVKAMSKFDRASLPFVLRGLLPILLARLTLPKNEATIETNKHVLDALRILSRDKKNLEVILGRVNYVLDQYVNYGKPQLEQSYQALKQQVMAQVQHQLQQQGLKGTMQVDIESIPEFQAQWRRMVTNLEEPFEQNLENFRKQIQELILAKPS